MIHCTQIATHSLYYLPASLVVVGLHRKREKKETSMDPRHSSPKQEAIAKCLAFPSPSSLRLSSFNSPSLSSLPFLFIFLCVSMSPSFVFSSSSAVSSFSPPPRDRVSRSPRCNACHRYRYVTGQSPSGACVSYDFFFMLILREILK